jgi:hypothetical protein
LFECRAVDAGQRAGMRSEDPCWKMHHSHKIVAGESLFSVIVVAGS